MAWRVLKDGAMLEVITGSAMDAASRDVIQTETRIYPRGHVLVESLTPDLAERWENGDAHLRSAVERVEGFADGAA